MRPRKPISQSQWDSGNRFRGLIETSGYMTKILNFIYVFSGCSLPEPHTVTFHVRSRGLNETAGSVSAISLKLRDRFPRSQWDRGIGSRGLNDTAELVPGLNETAGSVSAVSMRPQIWFPRSQWYRGNFMTPRESLQKRILVLIPFKGKPS
jgi:hypothetical protein